MLPLQVWKDEKAPAAALLVCATKKYGEECYDWEPEILRKQVEEDYGIKLSDLQSDKLQAAINVLTSNMFETYWHAFEKICHLFCNIPATFEDFDPLEADELIVGVAQASLIRHEGIDYDDEINAYAGLVFYHFGFSRPPVLFPTAIFVNKTAESDDKDKNEALEELFNAHIKWVTEYMSEIDL